jgi:hypothetical protein
MGPEVFGGRVDRFFFFGAAAGFFGISTLVVKG